MPILGIKDRKLFFAWFIELPPELNVELQGNTLEFKNKISLTYLKTCSICKGSISKEQKIKLCQNCNYLFHQKHISDWMKKNPSCPVCLNGLMN